MIDSIQCIGTLLLEYCGGRRAVKIETDVYCLCSQFSRSKFHVEALCIAAAQREESAQRFSLERPGRLAELCDHASLFKLDPFKLPLVQDSF